MGKRIIELSENTSFNDDDYMVLDNSTDTAKFTYANLWNSILSKLSTFTYELEDGDLTLIAAINNISSQLANVSTSLQAKADSSTTLEGYGITDAYTQTQINDLVDAKANESDVYNKSEIDQTVANLQSQIDVIMAYSNADVTRY